MFFKLAVDICARNGVALVVVPRSPEPARDATKWLSQHKAMVMLSGRYKTDDQLWFTFFHELCHVMKHSKRSVWIEADDGKKTLAKLRPTSSPGTC